MQMLFRLLPTAIYAVLAGTANVISAVSGKQITADIVTNNRRHLQTDLSCTTRPHGEAATCTEMTPTNDTIKFSVDCPTGTSTIEACLQDQKRICYQFNSRPCIGSFFCGDTQLFSLDCGNLFARSNGNDCSKTDCNVNCIELRDVPVDYNSVELDNSCFRLGEASTTTDGIVTTRWTHILSDSTEIQVTGTREVIADKFETCFVRVAGQPGSRCPCRVNCPPNTMAISYDCTDFTSDACAAIDCDGSCIIGGFPPPPMVPPVTPPVTAPLPVPESPPVVPPVTPPVTAPLQPPLPAPVSPPVMAPVNPPVTAPVTPPVTAPVAPPVVAPVSPPVTAPVAPPVVAPVTPPVTAPLPAPVLPPVKAPLPPLMIPVEPPVVAPVSPPAMAPLTMPVSPPQVVPVKPPVVLPVLPPVTPPLLPPVMITTSPPVVRPVASPTNNSTVCPLWWGLY